MNGPPVAKPRYSAGNPLETSVFRIALMGAIDFYKKRISPIGASRCGFHSSCSAFGLQAVREKGVLLGVIMTGDRLTRCNIFKGPGPDYLLLPDGRLFDPVSGNLLSEP
jgi:putative component of membrane protein insertase Oxa1/YidC/SpoIIIJ protein YidD